MIGIERAFITRWNALNLDSVVTGSIYRSQLPERTNPPYAILEVMADETQIQTRASRYSDRKLQVKIYNTDDDALETIAQTVRNSFVNADRALSNAMQSAVPNDGSILTILCEHNPIIIQESDQLWYAVMTFSVRYAEDGLLTPR